MRYAHKRKACIPNSESVNAYLILSFAIILSIFLIKYDIFFNGNGYLESASVLFSESYFNPIWDGLHRLDNGYLPWLQMLIAYLIHGVFGADNSFFILAQIISGVFISATFAAINFKYFRIYISNDFTRFLTSIFVVIYLIYSAEFGEFTFFHNFSQALLPTFILFYLAVPTQRTNLVTLIPISIFLFILVNSKPYYVLFFPLGLFGLLYAHYIAKCRNACLFYIFVMLATLIQISVMFCNRGTGLNHIIISDYSLVDGLKDSITYCLATYTFYILSPALRFFSNFHLFYMIGFTFTLLMLIAYTVYLYKARQFKKIYLLIGLNLAALGSLFITLYTATGILTFPRYVQSLDGFIPLLITRHFLVSNFAILLVLIMGLDTALDIVGLNKKSIALDNAVRFLSVATSKRFMLVTSPVTGHDNWFLYQNTDYITYHSPADWINEFKEYSSKSKPFLVINASKIGGISDFSRGVTWVDLQGTLSTSLDMKAQHSIPQSARSFRLFGAVGIPDSQEARQMQALHSPQPQVSKSNHILGKSNANFEITALMYKDKITVLSKRFMIWPGDNSRYMTTPELLIRDTLAPLKYANNAKTGNIINIKTNAICSYSKQLYLYFHKPADKYLVKFKSNSGVIKTRHVEPLSTYDRLRNLYIIPALQFLEGYPSNWDSPIGWIDVDCSELKDWNGTVQFEPLDNNKSTISLVTRANGELFTRLNDNIGFAILSNKQGENVGRAVSVRNPGKPYKYFLLDQPAIGAEMVAFLNPQNQRENSNIKMLWFGSPCPQCENELKQPNNK